MRKAAVEAFRRGRDLDAIHGAGGMMMACVEIDGTSDREEPMTDMSLARLLEAMIDKLVDSTMSDLRHSCDDWRRKYPGEDDEQVARRMIAACKRTTGGTAFATALAAQAPLLIPGVGLPATIGAAGVAGVADFKQTTNLQVALVTRIAALFGHHLDHTNPAHRGLVLGLVFGRELAVATNAAGNVARRAVENFLAQWFQTGLARKLYWDLLEKIGVTVAQRVTQRQIGRIIPFVGPVVAGAMNWAATDWVGENAIGFFKHLPALPC